MSKSLRLATFVAGPEPEGMGYGLLAHSGLSGDAGWRGNMPLVLLEWAKRKSSQPFCGRFVVAGGAIALRAAYFHEGSAGPVARAFGVFIDDSDLAAVMASERELFAAIPLPTLEDDFGQQPMTVSVSSDAPVIPWPNMGIAWKDRQIFVRGERSLEEIAFAALASVDPIVQRSRIRGWCTTGQLAASGDFLPVQNSNLLVTREGEPLANSRFVPATVEQPPEFEGKAVPPPDAYILWNQIAEGLQRVDGKIGPAMAWQADMADWNGEAIAWRAVEIMSQRRFAYANIVAAIVSIGHLPGDGREAVSAATMRKYLAAVEAHDPKMAAEVLQLLRKVGGDRPHLRQALDASTLSMLNPAMAEQLDDAALLAAIRLFAQRAEAGRPDATIEKLELLDDSSVWRALGKNLRSQSSGEGERRIHLSRARQLFGSQEISAAQRHKLLLRRLAMDG